mgnify:CR=1 FL=1
MLKEWMIFTCSLLTLAGASLPLSGCISRGQESISEGAAFGAGILREPGATKKADTKDQCATTGLWSAAGDISH